jgi:hypothetical protein
MPCNWDLQTVMADNTCYNDPRGVGPLWQSLGMGCHNPRLDIDNIQCDYSITDPTNAQFCAPENINVDYPTPSQWVRIATHYYYNHGLNYDVHPEIKVYCNGSLWADLGPHQFYTPEAPVTFEPADGAGMGEGNRFWIAADVVHREARLLGRDAEDAVLHHRHRRGGHVRAGLAAGSVVVATTSS